MIPKYEIVTKNNKQYYKINPETIGLSNHRTKNGNQRFDFKSFEKRRKQIQDKRKLNELPEEETSFDPVALFGDLLDDY